MLAQIANQINKEQDDSDEEYEIIEYDLERYDSKDLAPCNLNFVLPGKSQGNIFQGQSISYQKNVKLNSESRCLCNLKSLQYKNFSSSNYAKMPYCACEKEENYHDYCNMSHRNLIRNDYSINDCTCQKYENNIGFDSQRKFTQERNMNYYNQNQNQEQNHLNQSLPLYANHEQNLNENQSNNISQNSKSFYFSQNNFQNQYQGQHTDNYSNYNSKAMPILNITQKDMNQNQNSFSQNSNSNNRLGFTFNAETNPEQGKRNTSNQVFFNRNIKGMKKIKI